MGKCQYKTGFLSLSDCGSLAAFTCSECNRAVCIMHARQEEGLPLCLECYVQLVPRDRVQKEGLDDEYRREQLYRESGYAQYRQSDYRTFDKNAGVQHRNDALKTGDFQDS